MDIFEYQLLDFEISKNIEYLRGKRLFIWGAAEKGWQIQKTLMRQGIGIEAFCDSDVRKWGIIYDNIPVLSPYTFLERYKKNTHVCIISCIIRENELIKLLKELKIENISIVSYWGIKNACIANGIILENQGSLPIYDEIWRYRKRNYLRERFGFALNSLERLETYNSDLIWDLQPGKVASTTIKKRLDEARVPSLQVHTLNYPGHVLGESLKDVWAKKIGEKLSQKIRIVSSVREPLSRDYSAFWQPFKMERTYLMPAFDRDFQKMYENYVDIILNGFENACASLMETMECVWIDEFEWFNREIKKNCGIDIYEYPFDREKGYGIIKDKNVEVFIFKTEMLDKIMPELSMFLGKEIPSKKNDNNAEDAPYWLAYSKFKERLKLPRKYVEHYYKNNAYVDHFYTEEEQKFYLAQWESCIVDLG